MSAPPIEHGERVERPDSNNLDDHTHNGDSNNTTTNNIHIHKDNRDENDDNQNEVPYDTRGTLKFGERLGLVFVTQTAFLSLFSVGILLFLIVVSNS